MLKQEEKAKIKIYPPCRSACPAGVNVQAYIALISQGKFREAYELVRKYIPFPSVCGRVCFSPCEDACTRNEIDEPVSIRSLKRFISDYAAKTALEEIRPTPKIYKEKVAIIGAGPAGLTAAYELARLGYPVTVFEKDPKPGGMLRYGIPPYRLPKDILDEEIGYIKKMGVEIRCNVQIGRDITIEKLFNEGYKAIFIATGAHKCRSLGIEGENLEGVFHALEFLRKVNSGEKVEIGRKVAVIGGGNVAVDAARTALRLGSEATIIYRRSKEQMPAHASEVEEAEKEGVKFTFLAAPKRILGENGKVKAIECIRMRLGEPDSSGRPRPIPIEGSEFQIPVDTVILSIGEMPDTSFLPRQVCTERAVKVDSVTLETPIQGIFAGGDAVRGPASVIEAIADGKRAAHSIHLYLRGQNIRASREEEIVQTTWVRPEAFIGERKPRIKAPMLPIEERVKGFAEVELCYSEDDAIAEAHRCLLCGPCSECLEAEGYCEPLDAIVDENKCIFCANCEKVCVYEAISTSKHVAKIDLDLCKGCGSCIVECPTMALSLGYIGEDKILKDIKDAVSTWHDTEGPRILAFLCNWSAYPAMEELGSETIEKLPIRFLKVPCAGAIDPLHLIRAFMWGIDGIFIGMCQKGDCHYVMGNIRAENRIEHVKWLLKQSGIEPERIKAEYLAANQTEKLENALKDMVEHIRSLGPSPARKS